MRLILPLILLTFSSTGAQNPTVFDNLKSVVTAIAAKADQSDSHFKDILAEVQSEIKSLETQHRNLTKTGIEISDGYMTSLVGLVDSLQRTVNTSTDTAAAVKILTALNDDLRLKLSHLRNDPTKQVERSYVVPEVYIWRGTIYWRYGANEVKRYTANVAGDVAVSVHTKIDSRDVAGYEVWYVTKLDADCGDCFRRFGNLSSPTNWTLAPGNYFIWAKKGAFSSERQPLQVGGKGLQQSRDIDVTVR
jgi:hypothetical protein